jgi:hypothetical protein
VHQLLKAQIYPCSDNQPSSGATFRVLCLFMLLASEAKLSTHCYYNVLTQQRNSIFPHLVPDCYWEFLHVHRHWVHLQDLKRAGCQHPLLPPSVRRDLALRCPACPRLDYNHKAKDIDHGKWSIHSHLLVKQFQFTLSPGIFLVSSCPTMVISR